MIYGADVLADSISPAGVRVVTIKGTYPRFMHPEVLRHRVQSHSVMSSRAVPTEIYLEMVRKDMFVPEAFHARVKGMGYGEALDTLLQKQAETIWRMAGMSAAMFAEQIMEVGIDKSRANRLLEPFLPVVDIITATEWSNFLALRQPDCGTVPNQDFPAQPEFQIWARMMREAMEQSKPVELDYGQWHLPKMQEDMDSSEEVMAEASAGRLAKVSFATHEVYELPEKGVARQRKLIGDAHWSPSEHPCRPMELEDLDDSSVLLPKLMIPGDQAGLVGSWMEEGGPDKPQLDKIWCGNLRGWVQLRKTYPLEHDRGAWLEHHERLL